MITLKVIAVVFGAGAFLTALSDFTPDVLLAIVACFS